MRSAVVRPAVACELLEWDTAFFGRRIGRLFAEGLADDDLAAMRDWRSAHGVECLYCLVRPNDLRTIQSLEGEGFQLVDIRLTMVYQPPDSAVAPTRAPSGLVLRVTQSDDLPALRTLAANSHRNTRFFADPHFPFERSQALYAAWIEQSCQGAADIVLVALLGDSLVGYCTGLAGTNGAAQVGLLAVAQNVQGQGIGRTLLVAVMRELLARGARRVAIVTQGCNLPAYHMYQRCGFVTHDVSLWYHGWFE